MNRRDGATADTELSRQIQQCRDGALSWICAVLSKALADKTEVPKNINARHPDFATFAMKIGRAMGQEHLSLICLNNAEKDKSMFNIENNTAGACLLEFCRKGPVSGDAKSLAIQMNAMDTDAKTKFTGVWVGRKINKIFPHLEKVLGAKITFSGNGTKIYNFRFMSGSHLGIVPALPPEPVPLQQEMDLDRWAEREEEY